MTKKQAQAQAQQKFEDLINKLETTNKNDDNTNTNSSNNDDANDNVQK